MSVREPILFRRGFERNLQLRELHGCIGPKLHLQRSNNPKRPICPGVFELLRSGRWFLSVADSDLHGWGPVGELCLFVLSGCGLLLLSFQWSNRSPWRKCHCLRFLASPLRSELQCANAHLLQRGPHRTRQLWQLFRGGTGFVPFQRPNRCERTIGRGLQLFERALRAKLPSPEQDLQQWNSFGKRRFRKLRRQSTGLLPYQRADRSSWRFHHSFFQRHRSRLFLRSPGVQQRQSLGKRDSGYLPNLRTGSFSWQLADADAVESWRYLQYLQSRGHRWSYVHGGMADRGRCRSG